MRILHIGKYFPPVPGGMERFLGDLAQAQRAAGHDVSVLVHDDGRTDLRADPPWVMRCPVWVRLFFAPISPLFPLWLRRAIARHDPDVIHLHMPNLSAFWVLLLPSARRRPWIVHWHSDVERSKRSLRFLYPHYSIFERALLDHAETIVVTSPQYLEASEPLGIWRSKCCVVPLGVDPVRLPAVADGETQGLWKTDGLRLLAVGRLTYYKGFETLVRAVIGDPGRQLVIVGAGEERPRLERVLQQAGGPASITLLGEADDATLVRLMASCDVFCLPSIERTEAFGIVLLEAMRYGKPLVVSDIKGSGVGYVARHGQNAVEVPAGDEKAWRAALDELAAHPNRRHRMGLLGSQRYEREFGIDSVVSKLDLIYSLALRVETQSSDNGATAEPSRDTPSGVQQARTCSDRLLVVIPALNEAECIGEVIAQAQRYPGVDVLVIDDGSTDDTAAVALLHGARVLRAPLWQGAWGAIQTGMRYAVPRGYRAVITMDADGQHEPAYLPMLIEAASGADVVIAACPSRGSRLRHVAWSYFRMLTGLSFDDLTSGFRYYNGHAYRILASEDATLLDYQDIGVLLLLRAANVRIAEVAVAMNPRRSGASRVFSSWWTVARYMAETSLLCLSHWKPKR
ncbi:MAG: glycosyltransferase [Pseudomonadota bacterium]|nr:glycosyltransferase [Pseudomonadota bacterium]